MKAIKEILYLTYICPLAFLLQGVFCENTANKQIPIWNFHIMRKILSSFEYRGRDVAIWEDKETETLPTAKRQFYVTPTAEIIPSSAVCEFSDLTDTYKATFDIQLWNRHLELAAVENLKTFQLNVGTNQVHPLPFYQLRVVWKNLDKPKDFSIDDTWINNLQQHYVHTFQISATTSVACQKVVEVIKNRTHQFANSISLEYTLTASSVASKVLTIKAQHIISSSLYAKLNNMDTDSSVRHVRAKDLNIFSTDIANQVVASEITSGNFVSNADQVSLKDLITRTLDAQQVYSMNFTDNVWQSVYWNPDYARPDLITSSLNKELKIDQGGNITRRSESSSTSGGAGLSIGPFKFGGKSATSDSFNSEDVRNWLRLNDLQVEIKGERFVPKNLELFRLNLHKLNSRDIITTKLVQIQQADAPGSLKVTIGTEDPVMEENNLLRQKLHNLEVEIGEVRNSIKSQTDSLKISLDQFKTDSTKSLETVKIDSKNSLTPLQTAFSTLQTAFGTLQSTALTACRVCFQETEGSSQCQEHRNACSGWSTSATWSPAFRDDTDNRGGGCRYSWKLECRV